MRATSRRFTVLILPDSNVGEPQLVTRVVGNKSAQTICHQGVQANPRFRNACLGMVFEDGNGVIRYVCVNTEGRSRQVVDGRVTPYRWRKKSVVALLRGDQ